MIRLILVAVFLILFLILSIPIMLVEWLLGKSNPDAKSRSSLAIVNWAFRCVRVLAGVKVDYIGEENIPTDTPVLYIGNHRSYFDIVLTYPRVPRPTGYIAKKSMEKVPLLNIWMRNLHCLFLDRENIKAGMQTILAAIDLMKNGTSLTAPLLYICLYPLRMNEFLDQFFKVHPVGRLDEHKITVMDDRVNLCRQRFLLLKIITSDI